MTNTQLQEAFIDFIPSLMSTNVKIKRNLKSHGITTATFVGSSGFAVRFIPLKFRDSTYQSNSIFLKGKLKT